MKKMICLVLALCTFLSCMTFSASAAGDLSDLVGSWYPGMYPDDDPWGENDHTDYPIQDGCTTNQCDIPDLPELRIVNSNNKDVTKGTTKIAVDEAIKLKVVLHTAYNYSNSDYYYTNDYNSCGTSGQFYIVQNGYQWSYENKECAKINGNGNTINVTGAEAGELKVTVKVYVGYMIYGDGKVYDYGAVGAVSTSTVVQVSGAVNDGKLVNPFENIDPYAVENPFSDISVDDWSYEYIMLMYAAGLLDGADFGDGKAFVAELSAPAAPSYSLVKLGDLGSNASVHKLAKNIRKLSPKTAEGRGNSVLYMYNAAGSMLGVGSYTENPFNDVTQSMSFYNAILWASSEGIVKGYGKGKFGPYNNITREQFCTIVLRLAKNLGVSLPETKKAKTFADGGSISNYAKDAVAACQKAGIVNGQGKNMFNPKASITREEVMAMTVRFINAVC